MSIITHRTKIVATIGPASNSPEVLKQMIGAGMNVARLNFSHGSYEDHARVVTLLRQISQELDNPITLLQDLQGPKIRVGNLPNGSITINDGDYLTLVPMDEYRGEANTVSIDYPYLAEEAKLGESRKGVNLPRLNLRLPSMTEKDKQDLEFGLSQGVDWVSLSFVRKGEDIKAIKAFLAERNHADMPVMAKIEKPQAIENLESIIEECDGIMVARGDLGVELSPEKVPMLQKRIIKLCNMKTIPVITATQMLESMIHNPRPTRAEASDVANAIIDGTDAVMLSGESAVGDFPVKAVAMLAKIAHDVEADVKFDNAPPNQSDETHALSEALVAIDQTLDLRYIVTFTTSGYTSLLASKERPSVPVIAMTPNKRVYHRLNLVWGVIPILLDHQVSVFEDVLKQTESILLQKNLAQSGDKILIMAGIPMQKTKGTNFLKIHRIP